MNQKKSPLFQESQPYSLAKDLPFLTMQISLCLILSFYPIFCGEQPSERLISTLIKHRNQAEMSSYPEKSSHNLS